MILTIHLRDDMNKYPLITAEIVAITKLNNSLILLDDKYVLYNYNIEFNDTLVITDFYNTIKDEILDIALSNKNVYLLTTRDIYKYNLVEDKLSIMNNPTINNLLDDKRIDSIAVKDVTIYLSENNIIHVFDYLFFSQQNRSLDF